MKYSLIQSRASGYALVVFALVLPPSFAQVMSPEFQVNTYTTCYQSYPAVAAGGAGARSELLPPLLEACGNRAPSGNGALTVSAGGSVWGDLETNFSGVGNMTASFATEGIDVSVTRISSVNPNGFHFFESDNGTLYVTFFDGSGQRKLRLARSTNGGITWSTPSEVYAGPAVWLADIAGSGADLWLTLVVEDATGSRVIVAVSHNSGETFSAVDVGAPQDAYNRAIQTEVLTEDNTLVFFNSDTGLEADPMRIFVARSTDGGSTYELEQLSETPGDALGPLVRVVDGAIIAVWANLQDNTFRSVTSLDGGATWSGEVIAQNPGCCIRTTAVWGDTFYLIGAWAISRTSDLGLSWSRINHGEHGHESGFDVVMNGQGLHTLRLEAVPQGDDAYLWRLWHNLLPHDADLVNERLLGENLTTGSWQFPVLWGAGEGLMAAWAEQDIEGRTEAITTAISRDQGNSFSSWRVPSGPEDTGLINVALWSGLATMVYGKTTGSGDESNTSLFLAATPDDGGTTQTLELASGLNAIYGQGGAANFHGYLATYRGILIGTGTEDEAIIVVVTGFDEIFSDGFESGTP
jgi:hypothetical protein